ncbi:MAG: caspase family protein [Acidobacteria bacterium]|jgi:hypothetical protein|nr:caspase family protein [Acidobacteriota bacterium]
MRKFPAYLFAAVAFFYIVLSTGETHAKIIRVDQANSEYPLDTLAPGKQYLLLIAIDEYLRWPRLRGVVNEALLLKKTLVSRYHFDEIFELYNRQATKGAIRSCLIDFQAGRENQLTENDSLFIFFSGHGYTFEEEDWNGYWIPYNAGGNCNARTYWLSNSELAGLINKIKANHILIISDSCFASTLVAEDYYIPNSSEERKCWQTNYNKCTRKVLTSGSLERVPGQSVFMELLINELSKNWKSWIDMTEIYRVLEWKVYERTGNHPEYGNLKNANGDPLGSYILFTFPSLPY